MVKQAWLAAVCAAAVAVAGLPTVGVGTKAGGKSGKASHVAQHAKQAFAQADANHDGFLERGEFAAALKAFHALQHPGTTAPTVPSNAAAKRKGKTSAGKAQHHPFQTADANGDGKVSLHEFEHFLASHHRKHPSGAASNSSLNKVPRAARALSAAGS